MQCKTRREGKRREEKIRESKARGGRGEKRLK